MPRYKVTLEYDGTPYAGFQRQKLDPSIQQSVEEALEKLFQQKITVYGSGRTDSGVHALGQVIHFDAPRPFVPRKLRLALNFYLHDEAIRVTHVEEASDDFHARFSCHSRRYLYRVLNRFSASPLLFHKVWYVPQNLNLEAMQTCADMLIGEHDFSTFRAGACQAKSPIRTLDYFNIERSGDEVHFHIKAQSFLHHQVRNMVGTLILVGKEHWSVEQFKAAFAAKKRAEGGTTAPPDGLYFIKAFYDNEDKA